MGGVEGLNELLGGREVAADENVDVLLGFAGRFLRHMIPPYTHETTMYLECVKEKIGAPGGNRTHVVRALEAPAKPLSYGSVHSSLQCRRFLDLDYPPLLSLEGIAGPLIRCIPFRERPVNRKAIKRIAAHDDDHDLSFLLHHPNALAFMTCAGQRGLESVVIDAEVSFEVPVQPYVKHSGGLAPNRL